MDGSFPFAMPSLLSARPVRVWVVIGLFVLYLSVCVGLLFETIAPVADFPVTPNIAADSNTYWAYSGLKKNRDVDESLAGLGVLGPVVQALILRTDFNVMLCNFFLFTSCLWLMRWMPEFDRATFLLLMMANPVLIASLTTLNKEIFALTSVVYFIAYTRAQRFRLLLLFAALALSLAARWQQTFILLLFLAYESRHSPLRRHRRAGLVVTLVGFSIGYALINRLVPSFFQALLAQAQAGRTILILDTIQANFGFPLVVLPKILMDCLGHFVTPWYFVGEYLGEDFTNWHDQIFINVHCLLVTSLLLVLFFTGKLRLRHAAAYLLALYLLMIAVSPMVQPRYEYAAYVLLCLEASRYWRIGARAASQPLPLAAPLSPAHP